MFSCHSDDGSDIVNIEEAPMKVTKSPIKEKSVSPKKLLSVTSLFDEVLSSDGETDLPISVKNIVPNAGKKKFIKFDNEYMDIP
jgi:hypothetical protein